jgi:serine/threonine protein kinase
MRESDIVTMGVKGHTFTVKARYSFPEIRIIGGGSFGVVAAAYDDHSQKKVAIKRVRPYASNKISAKQTLREIRCLKLLQWHPNVRTSISLFKKRI